jgi:hypothetical protein
MSTSDQLLREVFTLAYHLKWSPNDVLALPVPERRYYLQLLHEQLQREHEAIDEGSGRA